MSNYNEELSKRKKAVIEKIANKQKVRDALKFNTTEWWLAHKRLNGYRLELETIISRIKNKDKPVEGIASTRIIGDNNNANKYY